MEPVRYDWNNIIHNRPGERVPSLYHSDAWEPLLDGSQSVVPGILVDWTLVADR